MPNKQRKSLSGKHRRENSENSQFLLFHWFQNAMKGAFFGELFNISDLHNEQSKSITVDE